MNALFRPLLAQSFKSSAVYLLIVALVLAISASTALKFSQLQIERAVALQAAEMLAADLVLSDSQPLATTWQQQAAQLGLKQSKVTVFSSMAYNDDHFVMVNVKAVDSAFPLRGTLTTQPQLHRSIQKGEVWLSQRALDLLAVQLGSRIHIADAEFTVSAVIEKDSNQETGLSGFSPTVIISQQDVAATHAIQVGSRIDYRLLLSGTGEQSQALTRSFKNFTQQHPQSAASSNLKLRTASEGNSRLMKPIENLSTFLQLANILTILLCGIAIALSSQRYVQQNQDHIALMRCMGAVKAQIWQAYCALLAVVLLIALPLGSLCGILLGYGLLQLMLQLIPHLELNFSVVSLLLGPLPTALLTSMLVLLGFVLPSIRQLLNTAPIRVIRQQEGTWKSMLLMLSVGAASLLLFSVLLTQNVALSVLVIGLLVVVAAVIYLLIWMVLKYIQGQRWQLSAYIRMPAYVALQISALALGLSLMSVLLVLRTDLTERWQAQLPENTPNQFVYGLPPFELSAFQAQLKTQGWSSTPLYPNVRGRLIAKNQQAFAKLLGQNNNSLRRELNLTQAERLPNDNTVLRGQAIFTAPMQVSVEANTAKELGIQVGDTLSFSLPEGRLDASVINLRSVQWESFSPNFFFIFSPKSLDENAGSYLGSFYVPQQDHAKLIQLIQQFSNTVFIDVSLILEEIKHLIQLLVQIMTLLAILVSVSGLLVLMACLNLMMDERKREVALLRAFGSSKKQLKQMLSVEMGLIGLFAGIVACIFAEAISAIVAYKMLLTIQIHMQIWLILPLMMMLVCALVGRYRLGYLTEIAPLKSLKDINS